MGPVYLISQGWFEEPVRPRYRKIWHTVTFWSTFRIPQLVAENLKLEASVRASAWRVRAPDVGPSSSSAAVADRSSSRRWRCRSGLRGNNEPVGRAITSQILIPDLPQISTCAAQRAHNVITSLRVRSVDVLTAARHAGDSLVSSVEWSAHFYDAVAVSSPFREHNNDNGSKHKECNKFASFEYPPIRIGHVLSFSCRILHAV